MRSVWLVRHGETDWNAAGRLQGWTDIPLNDAGKRQASELGPLLESESFDGLWSSDLVRAIETATLAYGVPQTDSRIREMDFGAIEGSTWDGLDVHLRVALRDFDHFSAPGGETAAAFVERIESFLAELSPGRHLVFTHGGVIRAISRPYGTDGFPRHAEIVKLTLGDC